MKNRYEIRGDTVVIFIKRRSGEVLECLVDVEDLEWLTKGNSITSSLGYAALRINGKKGPVPLHRLILNAPKGMDVDHANHNTMDNRKCNLRLATRSQNMQNLSGLRSNNTSGVRGVYWSAWARKWKVRIVVEKQSMYLGGYDDFEEAKQIANEAIKKYMPYAAK